MRAYEMGGELYLCDQLTKGAWTIGKPAGSTNHQEKPHQMSANNLITVFFFQKCVILGINLLAFDQIGAMRISLPLVSCLMTGRLGHPATKNYPV